MKGRAGRLAALCLAVGVAAGCTATSGVDISADDWSGSTSGVSGDPAVPLDPLVAAPAPAAAMPAPTPTTPAAPAAPAPELFSPGIEDRVAEATRAALERGAEVSIALLDRRDHRYLGAADNDFVETASVAKLFIADELAYRESTEAFELDEDERELVGRMLEHSDDDAANVLWAEYGGSEIVDDVAARYGLTATSAPYDGNWWNTITTAADLVDYYSGLLDGRGGLDVAHRQELTGHLRSASAESADGYDQRFGLPDGLPDQSGLAVKQGWMCCTAGRWIHLTTGVAGPDDRYVLVLVSREDVTYEGARPTNWHIGDGFDEDLDEESMTYPDTSVTNAADDTSAEHARATLTGVVRILFPDGRIG